MVIRKHFTIPTELLQIVAPTSLNGFVPYRLFDNFAIQHIRDQDDIYPVFRELFHKQNAN